MKNNRQIQLMLALMLVILAACSPSTPAAVAPTASIPTVAPAIAAPATAKPVATPTESVKFPTGKFVSVNDGALAHLFNEDGTFAFLVGNIPVVQGTYRSEGDLYIELTNDDSDPTCQGHPTYKWSFNGEKLSFSPVSEDTCRARREAFTDTYMLAVSSMPEIKIDAVDFYYTAPEAVVAGWVRVNLTNSGQEPHHVQFLRLNDGVTVQQFEETLKQGEGPALAMTKQVGGVGAVAPGGSAQAVIDLPAGEYVMLCLIPSPSDQTPHHAKGMLKSLTVEPASSASAGEPSPDLTVRLEDYSFDMPEALPAGKMTIKVVNDGPEPHEFNIIQLADGKTVEDVMEFLNAPDGPPPFTPVGGMNGLDAGLTGYAEVDLQPGTYAAICNIPSPKAEGHPHSALGMIKQFTVVSPATSSFPTGKFVSVNDGALAHLFNEDGTFAFLVGNIPVVQGTYQIQGDLYVELSNNDSDPTCQEHPTYKWFFNGEKLSFSPVSEDTCRARREAFADTYSRSE